MLYNTGMYEKSKRSRKPSFDFLSPYPLQRCADLLRAQADRTAYPFVQFLSGQWPYTLVIELTPLDEDTTFFQMRWRARQSGGWLFPYAKAEGYLKRQDASSTQVFGQVWTPAVHFAQAVCLVLVFGMAGVAVLLGGGYGGGVCGGLLVLLVSASSVAAVVDITLLRERLLQLIKGNLLPTTHSVDKPKHG
jgi:hypothetical protein